MEGKRLLSLVLSVLSVGACFGCQRSRGTAAVAHAGDRQGMGLLAVRKPRGWSLMSTGHCEMLVPTGGCQPCRTCCRSWAIV